jgi:DNA-binding CsgD family transcriptional regulator
MNSPLQPDSTAGSEATLINAIYDVAMQPHLWPKLLDAIREFCGADQCTVFYYDENDRQRNYAAAARLKLQTLDLYLDEFIAPQAAQINNQLRCLPDGEVVTDSDVYQLSGKTFAQNVGAKYMQCVLPNLHFQAGAVLLRGANGCAGLGLQNFRDSPPLTADGIGRLHRLIPHLTQAIHIRQRINLLEKANRAIEAVLKHLRLGVVLLDTYQQVTFINPEAMRTLSKCKNIHHQLHDRFQVTPQSLDQTKSFYPEEKSLKKEKRKIVSNDSCMKIEHSQGHVKLSFFTLGDRHEKNHSSYTEQGLPTNTQYLVLVQDSQRHCDLPIQYLKQAYGITPAESELIAHLINGSTLTEAAEKRAVTHETARWQMKNILQKTQIHSQNQLSQLMLSLMED